MNFLFFAISQYFGLILQGHLLDMARLLLSGINRGRLLDKRYLLESGHLLDHYFTVIFLVC